MIEPLCDVKVVAENGWQPQEIAATILFSKSDEGKKAQTFRYPFFKSIHLIRSREGPAIPCSIAELVNSGQFDAEFRTGWAARIWLAFFGQTIG